MNIEYYAKNGITLPMIPQWEMYYNSLAKHIGYQGAALYMELVHFFETVSKLNSAIETRSVEDVRIIYEVFLQYEYYNCGEYNYVEAKGALNAISNGKFELKTWIDDELDIIHELEEKFLDQLDEQTKIEAPYHPIGDCSRCGEQYSTKADMYGMTEASSWTDYEEEKTSQL